MVHQGERPDGVGDGLRVKVVHYVQAVVHAGCQPVLGGRVRQGGIRQQRDRERLQGGHDVHRVGAAAVRGGVSELATRLWRAEVWLGGAWWAVTWQGGGRGIWEAAQSERSEPGRGGSPAR